MSRPVPCRRVPAVAAWLTAFAAAVRARDYEAARGLFEDDGQGFGTVAARWVGLSQLEHDQWHAVWERTSGFDFDIDGATCWDGEGGGIIVVIAEWSSAGAEGRRRAGRATFALVRDGDVLRAAHSHFSMVPRTEA